MSRPELLTENQINELLEEHKNWERKDKSIIREIALKDFVSAVAFVNAVAIIAETNDHHPDILIYGWNKVRITLSTHDQGGLTELDFKVAGKIDETPMITEKHQRG